MIVDFLWYAAGISALACLFIFAAAALHKDDDDDYL